MGYLYICSLVYIGMYRCTVCCIISAYSTVLHEVDNDVEIIRLQYQYFDDTGTVLTMTLYQDMDNS